jgi:geranylgeranyl pyrophosphate synthase
LPILNLLETASESQRAMLAQRISDHESLDLPELLGVDGYAESIESAVEVALDLLECCRADLAPLGDSECRDALVDITRFLGDLLEKCRR